MAETTSNAPSRAHAWRALIMATLAFLVCFACWVINSVLVSYLTSARVFEFSESQVGLLLAAPFLTGALMRVPVGLLSDRFGGREVLAALMLVVAGSLWALSEANSFGQFLAASLGVGLAGASFAVGVAYVSSWFDKARQGTALGLFGMGTAGAALTTALAPRLLGALTAQGTQPEGWRQVPRVYAGAVVVMAVALVLVAGRQRPGARRPAAMLLAPLRDAVVWRFGLYYLLVFGGFVSLAQWIVPYGMSVYGLSVASAGLLAASFSLPSGLVRAAGGWLSDRFGPSSVMYAVFGACVCICLALSIPRMDVLSPGEGVLARGAGQVQSVEPGRVVVGGQPYSLSAPPERRPKDLDNGSMVLPRVARWQVPAVREGSSVAKNQLVAEGVTNIYFPANFHGFVVFLAVFGLVTGVGMGGVYKFIPEHYPQAVGVVGGAVGLLGAMGGFLIPPLFSYLLKATGLWASCWWALSALSLVCLGVLHGAQRSLLKREVPELVRLLDRSVAAPSGETAVEQALARVPFFTQMKPEELAELAKLGERRRVAASEVVFREGDAGDHLYVILSGAVAVRRAASPLATLGSGSFFGELALIDGEPRSATITTTEPCEFFVIGRREFLHCLSRSPKVVADLLLGLSARLRDAVGRTARGVAEAEG